MAQGIGRAPQDVRKLINDLKAETPSLVNRWKEKDPYEREIIEKVASLRLEDKRYVIVGMSNCRPS